MAARAAPLSNGTPARIDTLIGHYHEIGLKGRNRDFFETALVRNLTRALRGTGYRRVRRMFGRVIVDLYDDARTDEAFARAARVFGLVSVGAGTKVDQDLDAIAETSLRLITSEPFESFRVRARRTHAAMDVRSRQINEVVGQRIKDSTGARVDLKNAEATVWIELFGRQCVVYTRRAEGPGGLPVGVSGRVLALISGGIDSPVAAWRMARRGAEVELIHFHGQPYTDHSSVRQTTELAEVLARYQLRSVLHLVPLADLQREIVTHASSSMRLVLYRRAMMRIAQALAQQREAGAIVTGDSLGQVASQTLHNIRTIDAAVPGADVLRPLIGMDKQEIIDQAIRIGTYDVSTRSYQDCCVLFEPRSPTTRSEPRHAEGAEQELDMDALVEKALGGLETRVIELPDPTD